MDTITIDYLILAFLGMTLHVLMKIQTRRNKEKISFKHFIKDKMNWVRIALALISTVALIIMADDLCKMFHITINTGSPAKSIFAFASGYFNHSLVRNILKSFKKRVKDVN
jgi:hypothetical protein